MKPVIQVVRICVCVCMCVCVCVYIYIYIKTHMQMYMAYFSLITWQKVKFTIYCFFINMKCKNRLFNKYNCDEHTYKTSMMGMRAFSQG
jgi:hypothetical protein